MCALTAGQRGRRVMVLDRADRAGKKILISGGGRCNFTNLGIDAENYLSANPYFCKSALNRYTPHDFISLVEKYGVPYHEKTAGQLFCDCDSGEVVDLLLEECRRAGVAIKIKCAVEKIRKEGRFALRTGLGEWTAESLVIATGGLSMPQIGASGFGYAVAKQFGLNVLPCRPGLVPLTLSDGDLRDLKDLSGISVKAAVSCSGQRFLDDVLFTHKGLSGPAILQISNYWNPGDEILMDLFPDFDIGEAVQRWRKERPKAELKSMVGSLLPKRLAHRLLGLADCDRPLNRCGEKEIAKVAETFHRWRLRPSGTEGYQKAEVTTGGVDTAELSSKTFEAKKVKGLYFIGEVLDVTGWLGGYNLQWAWSSGHCAGQFV